MIHVYQSIFDIKRGNCQAATWASLLHLSLDDVPNFVEYEDDHEAVCDFLKGYGYYYHSYVINPNRNDLAPEVQGLYQTFAETGRLPEILSINGYFEATVYSPGYFNKKRFLYDPDYVPVGHAVVIDKDFNIVHDPNPKYKAIEKYPLADELGYNGVIGVCLYHKLSSN